jgi:DNA-binding NtrC family response regulator
MTATKRILVIDDEPGFCVMMKDLLSGKGFEVEYAAHPIVAAEQAMSGEFDAVTLDLNLREFDGSDVWDLYRKVGLKTPVIVISGYLTPQIEESMRRDGVQFFLAKPFRTASLLRMIEEATGARTS